MFFVFNKKKIENFQKLINEDAFRFRCVNFLDFIEIDGIEIGFTFTRSYVSFFFFEKLSFARGRLTTAFIQNKT